ncbi:MAG: CaiB/BaiF CoA transferase family protein, partial [Paracoccaceae bacterium]
MGPLAGLKIIEVTGLGAAPYCGMLLADMGAEVIRVDRPLSPAALPAGADPLIRGRRSVALNLKTEAGVAALLRLVERADALFEGFRPGVAERLGFGPDACLERNPRLVFGRLTGWGREGPLAQAAGHDINYIALSGALHSIGRAGQKPVAPLNLVGDFGGGGMLLAFGMVCALLEAGRSGQGQVVDAAMLDGAASLMSMFFGFAAAGGFDDSTGSHLLGTAAPFYDTYETADGKYVAIGSLEPRFFAQLLELTGLDAQRFAAAGFCGVGAAIDTALWPELREALEAAFRGKSRDEWCRILEGTDVCFAPVLGLSEVHRHPHNRARDTLVEIGGVRQPAPAPRFSRTRPATPVPGSPPG